MWRKNVNSSQTIFALTTGKLPSAVAIVRLAGSDSFAIAKQIFSRSDNKEFCKDLCKERGMFFGKLRDLQNKFIDEVLLLSFVKPHSFTGEDIVEFHCHGAIPIVERLEQVLLELGARPAERGEFSYRAYLNEKLTGHGLEKLADLFVARNFFDLTQVYNRKERSLEKLSETIRSRLITLQAILDTAVDFSEEEEKALELAMEPLEEAIRECSEAIQRYSSFRMGSQAPRIVLAGRPNAGKSSLFNALLGRVRTIVHSEPGTTRDVIEEEIDSNGFPWKLVDTAGFHSEAQGSEAAGLEMGESYLSGCAFWVLVVDGSVGMQPEELRLLEKYGDRPVLIAWNKKDLSAWKRPESSVQNVYAVSAQTGEGISDFWAGVQGEMEKLNTVSLSPLPNASAVSALNRVFASLKELKVAFSHGTPPELLAERNRLCIDALEAVIGEVDIEQVLDRVFSDFCIGK